MITEQIYGQDVQIFIDGTLVGCGQTISVKSSRKEIPVTCAGSGNTEKARVGKMKHQFSLKGIWRISTGDDIAGNITTFEMWKKYLLGEEVTIEIKPEIVSPAVALPAGTVVYTGTGYLKDMGMDGTDDEAGSFDAAGFFNDFTVEKVPA